MTKSKKRRKRRENLNSEMRFLIQKLSDKYFPEKPTKPKS